MEPSPRGAAHRSAAQNTTSEEEVAACHTTEAVESLREDDICALCGQAWVTRQEVTTFLSLKNQEQLQRTPVVSPEPAKQVCATPSRTYSASKRGASRGHSSTDSLLSLVGGNGVKAKAAVPPASAPKAPPVPPPAPVVTSAEMVNMMILCDGCDGSFHMICIGKIHQFVIFLAVIDSFCSFFTPLCRFGPSARRRLVLSFVSVDLLNLIAKVFVSRLN